MIIPSDQSKKFRQKRAYRHRKSIAIINFAFGFAGGDHVHKFPGGLLVRSSVLVFLLVGWAGAAVADESGFNEETFEYYASIIRQLQETHSRLIDNCAKKAIAKMDGDMKAEVERETSQPVGQATREVCRRMVKGIASGAVTYEIYRAWYDTPEGNVRIPDYQ
ncbi:hypothetical protein [Rhizobium sp. L9]|uniref:hypothetical protein n=1 Tax=Rhizobium sp. L9 TaxID=1340738 RepID=UPI001596A694|nr:hypothetical protein [Rhizobium sp. L9]